MTPAGVKKEKTMHNHRSLLPSTLVTVIIKIKGILRRR